MSRDPSLLDLTATLRQVPAATVALSATLENIVTGPTEPGDARSQTLIDLAKLWATYSPATGVFPGRKYHAGTSSLTLRTDVSKSAPEPGSFDQRRAPRRPQ